MAAPTTDPSRLDQIVKGAPAPNTSLNDVAGAAFANPPPHSRYANTGQYAPQSQFASSAPYGSSPANQFSSYPPAHDANDHLASLKTPRPPYPPTDPTELLPSSPPQIYLNLLILEASLRSQYLTLRARRRQNTFVLTLLALWNLYFLYVLWLRPRADGSSSGSSKYWLVDIWYRFSFMTGVVTALLFWATGQWERGVRWPRRWIGVANRGLRGMNAKIVVIRGPWWSELVNWLMFVLPFSGGLWGGETGGSSYHYINASQEKSSELVDGRPRHRVVEGGKEYAEEDIAMGGDVIKLLLLPKPFTPAFREGWETYRTEYWERENERRAELRKRVRARQREIARSEGGWLWWTGWRGWKRARGLTGRGADVEKSGHAAHHHQHAHHLSATGSLKDRKRRPSALRGREGSSISNSRSSSRSTTPTPDIDDRLRFTTESRERRWSTSTTGSTATRSDSRRAKKPAAAGAPQATRPAPPSRLTASGGSSRPTTPNESLPWQSKRMSSLSTAESVEEYDGETSGYDGAGLARGARASASANDGLLATTTTRPQVKRRQSGDREAQNVFPNAPSA